MTLEQSIRDKGRICLLGKTQIGIANHIFGEVLDGATKEIVLREDLLVMHSVVPSGRSDLGVGLVDHVGVKLVIEEIKCLIGHCDHLTFLSTRKC